MNAEQAITLAIDAIHNDPRREPYGHHQKDRERAVRELERLREGLAATPGGSR